MKIFLPTPRFSPFARRRWPIVRYCIPLLLFSAGCPEISTKAPPAAVCTKPEEQCKLPDGPLGVCGIVECKEGEKGPCLACIPQH